VTLNNVMAKPHMESAMHETRETMATIAVHSLMALSGDRPKNLTNAGGGKAESYGVC
jgi:phosphogluconate 2-dehydrogenase